MEDEIEITFQPTRKIIILECAEFSNTEFFKRVELMARSGHPVALNWAEGIVFLAIPYHPENDAIIEQALKGTMYLASVLFSSMPEYQSIKKIGALEVPIIDQTSISYLRQVATWLKKRTKN
ncbi:MAG: hypothetical protein JSW19_02570 [Candidatus Bathyarchaeota archaeon]|nr:MAG: hypothetical protein JSW19_02570 [Candidatus Bathyarchaeota archaeon]